VPPLTVETPVPSAVRLDTVIFLVALLSAESDIKIVSAATGVAFVGYVYIIGILA
jgi:hypothetical protein